MSDLPPPSPPSSGTPWPEGPPTHPPATPEPDDRGSVVSRVWTRFRSWPLWARIAIGFVVLAIIASPFLSEDDDPDEAEIATIEDEDNRRGDEPVDAHKPQRTTTTRRAATTTTSTTSTTTTTPTTTTTTTEPPPTTTTEPPETMGQANARRSAESYLRFSAFSRSGLIEQLKFEGFSTEDATYAVDAVNPDWNEQAAKSAESYLSFSSFSRQGLIDQLLFEGFTREQAEYGVSAVGY